MSANFTEPSFIEFYTLFKTERACHVLSLNNAKKVHLGPPQITGLRSHDGGQHESDQGRGVRQV